MSTTTDRQVFTEGDHVVHSGSCLATNTASITARGDAVVHARDWSGVKALERASVLLRDSAVAFAFGESVVNATGDSWTFARENATVYASERARVTAHGNTTIYASGDAWVCMAEDFTGTVTLVNNATSRPERYATYNED